MEGEALAAGDAVRLTGGGTPWLMATEPSEVIVWESDQAVRR